MKTITKILNIIYGFIVMLFLLDSLTSFDIKSQIVKSFVYFGILIETPLLLIWNALAIKTETQKIIGTIVPIMIVAMILISGPLKLFFSVGAWQTQTLLYQNAHLNFKTIEFQMQDIGALGYNERVVEVLYLTPFFMITNEAPKEINKKVEWVKVDKNINELGLKFQ